MKALRLFASTLVAVVSLLGQSPTPTYTDWGNTKQIEIGTTKCLLWVKLTGANAQIAACYVNGVLHPIGASPLGDDLMLEYRVNGDSFLLLYYVENGVAKYQIAATPDQGMALVKEGSF